MAIYVMSDIHGCYKNYMKALEIIKLKQKDTLYVLGDVVDRGEHSMKILLDMMYQPNIIPLIGNHEVMALSVLKVLSKEITHDTLDEFTDNFVGGMYDWFKNGGKTTCDEFKSLSSDERESILEYIGEFELYEELSCNGKDFILVHAGLSNFSPDRPLYDYALDEMLLTRLDYSKTYFKDKYLVTGHTPTKMICGEDKIYRKNNHIAIDCGCVFGGKLGVLCLDTMEEMYF